MSGYNLARIEELDSFVRKKKESESLPDDEAAALLSNTRSHDYNDFVDALNDLVAATGGLSLAIVDEVDALLAEGEKKLATAYSGYTLPVGQVGSPSSTGVFVLAALPDAYEGKAAGVLEIIRPLRLRDPLTVNISVSGTAGNGMDYENISTTVVIPAYERSVRVSVNSISDAFNEGDETVTLTVNAGGYTVGAPNTALVTIHDVEAGAAAMRLQEGATTQQGGVPARLPAPHLGTRTFFQDVTAYLDQNDAKLFYEQTWEPASFAPAQIGPGIIHVVAFRAKDYALSTRTVTTPGKVISDLISDPANSSAEIILNGALCNWKCSNVAENRPDAEPGTTIGIVLNGGVIQATSTDSSKGSYKDAGLRYWFGQTLDKSDEHNGSNAASFKIAGRGHPPTVSTGDPKVDLDAAIGGLISLILPDASGIPRMRSFKDDRDLETYDFEARTRFKSYYTPKNRIGFNVIGVDRQTGIIVIASKRNYQGGLLGAVQLSMFLSGTDEALVTDGGGSTGCYVKGKFQVESDRHNPASRPGANNTVTNYFVFTPES